MRMRTGSGSGSQAGQPGAAAASRTATEAGSVCTGRRRACGVRLRSLTAVMILVAVGACAPRGVEPPRADPGARLLENRAFTEEERRDIFVQQGLRLGARTGVEIRTQLGAPDSESARPVPNPHDPAVVDSLLTWTYPELEAEVYRTADGRRLLAQALVTGNRHLTFPEIGIGEPASAVRDLLGPPDVEGPGELEYRCGSCTAPVEPVIFELEGDRVAAVRFLFPLD
jgi:hypothetical protein